MRSSARSWMLATVASSLGHTANGDSTVDGIVEIGYATATHAAQDYGYVRVEPTWRWSKGNVSTHLEARYEFDLLDSLEPGRAKSDNRAPFSKRAHIDDNQTLELREFFLDYQAANFTFRAGKQQIVWGEADGLKLLDVLNPQSFAELTFADFDQSRTPLWATNLTLYRGGYSVQFVWLPDSSAHDWVEGNGVYTLPLADDVRRAGAPSGDDFGLRAGYDGNGWNVSVYAARRHQDLAISDDAANAFFPRETMLGLSGSLVAKNLVLRFEARHSDNRWWRDRTNSAAVNDESMSALVGFDWTVGHQTWLSLQALATEGPKGRVQALMEDAVTLTMNRSWNHNKGNIELQAVMDTHYDAGFGRLSVAYELTSRLQLMLRYTDIYSENVSGLSGLTNTDHVLLGIRVSI